MKRINLKRKIIERITSTNNQNVLNYGRNKIKKELKKQIVLDLKSED